jgi:hypothetical protein
MGGGKAGKDRQIGRGLETLPEDYWLRGRELSIGPALPGELARRKRTIGGPL